MVKTTPRINLKKIKNLREYQYHIHNKEYSKIEEILNEIPKIKSKNIKNALRKYSITRTITIVEDTFRSLAMDQIDHTGLDITRIFGKNQIIINMANLDDLKNTKITRGSIVATNFNFQNYDVIDSVISKIVGYRFFDTIKEILRKSVEIGLSKIWDSSDNHPKIILKNWKKIEKLFDMRNQIVHNMNTEVIFSDEELLIIIGNIIAILEVSTFLIFLKDHILTNNSFAGDRNADDSNSFLIKDFSELRKIIIRRTKEFKKTYKNI